MKATQRYESEPAFRQSLGSIKIARAFVFQNHLDEPYPAV